MKIKKSSNKNKIIVITVTTVLLISIFALVAYYSLFKDQPTQPEKTTEPQTSASSSDSTKTEQSTINKEEVLNTDTPPAPANDNSSNKKQVQLISSFNQSNGVTYIRGGINYPVADGTCYAALRGPSGKLLRKETTTLPNPASTDCKTIAIPNSELESGTWSFTLNYTSDQYEGASDETSFDI